MTNATVVVALKPNTSKQSSFWATIIISSAQCKDLYLIGFWIINTYAHMNLQRLIEISDDLGLSGITLSLKELAGRDNAYQRSN